MEPHHAKELPYIQVHTAQCHSPTSHSSLIFPDSRKTTETKKKKRRKNIFKQKWFRQPSKNLSLINTTRKVPVFRVFLN